MRQIVIDISPRIGVDTDNSYYFSSTPRPNPSPLDSIYAFAQMQLNYSLFTSNILSSLLLSMDRPVANAIRLRSGQYIQITDNGVIVFQGVLRSVNYILLPADQNGICGSFVEFTLAPSIYQFTIMPLIFDSDQLNQIKALIGIDLTTTLVSGTDQSIATSDLLDYIISNSDYFNFFKKTISAEDLGKTLNIFTTIGEPRDNVLRQSIDYYNCVLYQQEDGTIKIKQLDANNIANFTIDLQNKFDRVSTTSKIPTIPVLQFSEIDNAYITPAVISNYNMVSPEVGVGAVAQNCILSYAPNPKFFPRLTELQKGGWFVGEVGVTQINNNVVSDPTTVTALNNFFAYPDVYMIASQATGVKDQFLASYQALLTAKQTALAIAGYASLSATVSLDDPNLPSDLGNIIGTIMQIQNSNLPSGIIATASRSYSAQGSYLSFNIAPMGSFTGFWKNSK